MLPRPSLKTFLSLARGKASASPGKRALPLTLVVGNESADLDSLCSAVIFAYLRSTTPSQPFHLPLSNLPRDDLALRSEMTAVLKHAGLAPGDLLTLDDLPDLEPQDTRWLLVDHNSLTGPLARFGARVVGCIDHHVDEGGVPADCGPEPRVLETCGSCVSLIAEYCRPAWDELAAEGASSADAAAADRAMALMALGVIFSDTVNLTAADKVTPTDTAAVAYLEAKLRGTGYDRAAYCDEIAAVRMDLSGLSLRDIFRKDYKEWTEGGSRLGTCSVVQNFGYLLGRAGSEDVLVEELGRWAEEKALDLVSVMTLSTGGGRYERELLLWARNEKAVRVARRFEEAAGGELGLSAFKDGVLDVSGESQWRRAWKQGSLKQSRKQIAPLIREAMAEEAQARN